MPIEKLEKRIKNLERIVKGHTHLGYDKTSKLKGHLLLDGKSQFGIGNSFRGYGVGNQGEVTEFMTLGDSVGTDVELGVGNRTRNTQTTLQNFTEPYNIYKGNWVTATDYIRFNAVRHVGFSFICYKTHTSGASTEPGVGGDWATVWKVMNYWSFNYAFREPLLTNSGKSITNGGNTIQDTSQTFGVNELADSYITVTGSAIGLETYQIASNTADTITISGTWGATDTDTNYVVFRPVFLGSANYPWKRLYLMDDIRFGKGSSSGSDVIYIKYGSGTPEASVTANVGSLYLRTDGGANTTLYVKESGVGNTGWIAK